MKGYKKGSKNKGSKDEAPQNSGQEKHVEQLTAMVEMLAKEVQSLKEETEARRKTTSSAGGASSSEWETMTNPQ